MVLVSHTASTSRNYLQGPKNNVGIKRRWQHNLLNANNPYYYHSKLSESKFEEIVQFFCDGFTAQVISRYTEVSRITINKVLMEIRERIAEQGNEKQIATQGFAQAQVNDLKQVLGIQVKGNKVKVEFVSNCCMEMFGQIAQKRKNSREIIFRNNLNQYTALVDIKKKRYVPTNNRLQGFRECEKFWEKMYHKILESRGIRKDAFYLHMKEGELRHNLNSTAKLNKAIMQMIRNKPLASFYRNPN